MIENIRFSDGTVLSGQISISGHLCTIKNLSGPVPEDTSLIQLYKIHVEESEELEEIYAKFEGYTTVYKVLDDGVILSDDGSAYQEQEPIESHVFTMVELKEAKKSEVSVACEQVIYDGITVGLAYGPEHFSLTEKDQINLFGKQMQLAAGVEQLEYHQDGHPCRYYSAIEMQQIITAAMEHVSYHTTYCNSLNMWIAGVETIEELENIYYGADVPAEYQSEVLKNYIFKIRGESDEIFI